MNKVRTHHKDPLAYYEVAYTLKDYIDENTVIVCIGTDRCIGDALGPLVGTYLKEKKFPFPVYGTIAEPIHALNLEKRLSEIKLKHPKANILGVDACLGDSDTVGEVQWRDYPISPGKGVGKCLPEVGKCSIIGIVDSSDNNELFTNRTIRLNLIMDLANVVVDSIIHGAYLAKVAKKSEVALD